MMNNSHVFFQFQVAPVHAGYEEVVGRLMAAGADVDALADMRVTSAGAYTRIRFRST
jgi:hypothetical protein